MRMASSGVAWWAKPVIMMATTSGLNSVQVFEQLQAVVAGAEVPVEDGQVDGVLVGQEQGRLGVGRRQDAAAQAGPLEPLAEGPADRLLVIHDQDGFRFARRRHAVPSRTTSLFTLIAEESRAMGSDSAGRPASIALRSAERRPMTLPVMGRGPSAEIKEAGEESRCEPRKAREARENRMRSLTRIPPIRHP